MGRADGEGGGLFLFSALVFSSISIRGGEIRWNNRVFTRKWRRNNKFLVRVLAPFRFPCRRRQQPGAPHKRNQLELQHFSQLLIPNCLFFKFIYLFFIILILDVFVSFVRVCMNATFRRRDRKWKSSLIEKCFPLRLEICSEWEGKTGRINTFRGKGEGVQLLD